MEVTIDGKTELGCIIGKPVHHSISPQIYNSLFKHFNVNRVYVAFEVAREELETVVAGFRVLGIYGMNITIPHKEQMLRLVDEVDQRALRVGAVNTVVNRDGVFRGYNTDVEGFSYALKVAEASLRGRSAAVLGAGGAARAVISSLVDEGCQYIYILNRSLNRAKKLASEARRAFTPNIKAAPLEGKSLKRIMGLVDIVINTTPIGMKPWADETPVPKRLIESRHVIFDTIYSPSRTRLLAEAENRGAKVVRGLDMLIGQAVLPFKLWTGIPPPLDIIEKAACAALGDIEK